jgi:hypothetical protein
VATCCSRVPLVLQGPARWLYDHVGNPFEFPANAVFAFTHDVPWARWDQIVGDYPVIPSFGDVRSNKRLAGLQGVWRVGSSWCQPWLVGGWSAPKMEDRPFRSIASANAVVMIPNLMPEPEEITVWMRAEPPLRVRLEWNGNEVAEANLTATWTAVSFGQTAALHTNELAILAPRRIDGRVDVSDIHVQLR